MNNNYVCTANNKQFILNGAQITKIANAQKINVDLNLYNTNNALELFTNKITCGDCIELTQLLPDNSIDAIITDPPYGGGGIHSNITTKKTRDKYLNTTSICPFPDFAGDSLNAIDYQAQIQKWLNISYYKLKDGGIIACFIDWRNIGVINSCLMQSGFNVRGCIVWDKTSARITLGLPINQCEFIVYALKGKASKERRKLGRLKGLISGIVSPKDRYHQTGKPTKVMEQLLQICTPHSLILDPFAGSGTTCIAANNLGHDFIGFEKVSDICKLANLRLQGKAQSLQDHINAHKKSKDYQNHYALNNKANKELNYERIN